MHSKNKVQDSTHHIADARTVVMISTAVYDDNFLQELSDFELSFQPIANFDRERALGLLHQHILKHG